MGDRSIRISPSILSADFTKLGDEIRRVEDGGADMIHVDVMDGHFVPNITLGPVIVEAVRRATDLPVDVHLMIEEPGKYAPVFIDAGATYVVFHAEACPEPAGLIERIRELGARPGLAINPPNPASQIEPFLSAIDLALVMTVNPGFSGQSFIAGVMPKLRRIADWKAERSLDFLIAVDGGIGPETAATVVEHGGEVLAAASAIFRAEDPAVAVRELREIAERALNRMAGGNSCR
jgi:ribulose-phosphate 3-epimerase